MILFFYGLAGAGKSFVGRHIADNLGIPYYEADELLTDEMKQAIITGQPITQEMVDKFMLVIISFIKNLLATGINDFVISQALYRIKNRAQIAHEFPNIQFIEVTASDEIIFDRLAKRNDWVSTQYAKEMQRHFQRSDDSLCIRNDQDGTSHLDMQVGLVIK